jgi:chorismate mutase / prephenate dehydratase
MTLEEIRKGIDAVDNQILRLLEERSAFVHEVGVIKKREGLEIYAPEREDALLQNLARKNRELGGRLPDRSIWAIYREIMSAALALEQDLKIAYLGPPGTWTHQAALNKFGQSVKYVPMANFHDVFEEVARRRADYGVVPIENSTEGAVNHTLDLFADSPLSICAQIFLRIDNALLANCPRDEIEVFYSHPQVFGQCRNWLQQHFPKVPTVDCSSTTKAAELAAKNPKAAALGGELAGQLHGLTVLEKSIQDSATNTTRFMVLSERPCPPTGSDRTSIMFSVRNEPGSLYQALAPFSECAVNMSKIESRPSKRRAWEYFFFVDVLGHHEDPKMVTALAELKKHCSMLKILGSYPNNEETAQATPVTLEQVI